MTDLRSFAEMLVDAEKRIAELEAALRTLCDSVDRIAFEMPPPNAYTPQFVLRTQAARMILQKSSKS